MHETEEEQIQAMKKWWAENGTSIIVGLVIGVAAIVGWRAWGEYQIEHAQEASALYSDLVDKVDEDLEFAEKLSQTLRDDYASTPYPHLASLQLAKAHIELNDEEQAIAALEPVVEHASGEMQQIARLRLARLLRDKGALDAGLSLLEGQEQGAFAGLYAEVTGDLQAAKGLKEKAAFSYQQALVAGTIKEDWVRMKLDALGVSSQHK